MEHTLDIEIFTPAAQENATETKTALQAAINGLRSAAQFAILESLTEISFPIPAAAEISLDKWPKGRLFCETFELRWKKNRESYRTVFVKESGFETPAAVSVWMSQKDSGIEKQFWGREEEPSWIFLWAENDARLGRSLEYQCLSSTRDDTKKNVQLQVCHYYDDHGRLIFWRYKNMRWTT